MPTGANQPGEAEAQQGTKLAATAQLLEGQIRRLQQLALQGELAEVLSQRDHKTGAQHEGNGPGGLNACTEGTAEQQQR